MINVIVAEDQQLILKDLCSKILKSDNDINIQATAINGKDAYEKIIKYRPDIVFTDISMPILSGIDVIEKVKDNNIDTKFVIISGYKDFDYARKAIKLGVDEYLLKPIKIDDISLVLNNLKAKIFMKKHDYEQHLIESLLNSNITTQPKINTNFNYKEYYVMILNAGPYSNFTIDYVTPFCQVWDEINLKEISKKHITIEENVFVVNGKSNNEVICVFTTNDSSLDTLMDIGYEVITLCENKGIPVTIGVSRAIKHIENIGIRSQIARTILKNNLIFSKSKILDCSKIEVQLHNNRFFFTDDIEKRLKFNLNNNKKEEFINECFKLINVLEKNTATQMEIDKCFKSLINTFNFNSLINNSISNFELKIDECISNSENYKELLSNFNIILEQYLEETTNVSSKHNNSDNIIESSKKYIKSHFSEDINVNDIANVFSVSPAYFSRLFKKHVGIPPVVYLTNYRMEKACEIFKTTKFTIKEVAELCGYSDQFYFSKAFKSTIGIPPSEYKTKYEIN